jgi:hypothetical protein
MDALRHPLLCFRHRGATYALVRTARELDSSAVQQVPRWRVEPLLREVLRGPEAAHIRRSVAYLASSLQPARLSDESLHAWLMAILRGPGTVLQEVPGWGPPAVAHAATASFTELERALSRLGDRDLRHRGERYRVLLEAKARGWPGRNLYETLSQRERDLLLAQCAADRARPEVERDAIRRLIELLNADAGQRVLLLRRLHSVAQLNESSGALTPSQWKGAREEHYLELLVLTPEEQPVAGVRFEIRAADGAIATLSTDADGFARWSCIPAGDATIRLAGRDGRLWRPLAGAGAMPAQRREEAPRWHVLQRGECLATLAQRNGLPGWHDIWEHPANQLLRQRRKTPNVLLPGDRVAIPPPQTHELVRAVDATHRIELRAAAKAISVRVRNVRGQLLKHAAWSMFGDNREVPLAQGSTDAQGLAHATLPAGVSSVLLVTEAPAMAWTLQLGALHAAPDQEQDTAARAGLTGRLQGLGFAADDAERDQGLALFQQEVMQRDACSPVDAQLLQRLVQEYGA